MVEFGVGVIPLVKELAAYLKEKKEQDPELLGKFLELQTVIYEMAENSAELRSRVAELEQRKELYNGLVFDSKWGVWREEDSQSSLHYCTKCITSGHRVPLQEGTRGFRCGNCDSWFEKPETRPKPVTHNKSMRPSINPWFDY